MATPRLHWAWKLRKNRYRERERARGEFDRMHRFLSNRRGRAILLELSEASKIWATRPHRAPRIGIHNPESAIRNSSRFLLDRNEIAHCQIAIAVIGRDILLLQKRANVLHQ